MPKVEIAANFFEKDNRIGGNYPRQNTFIHDE